VKLGGERAERKNKPGLSQKRMTELESAGSNRQSGRSERVTATRPTPSKTNEAKKGMKMWAEWREGGSRSEAGEEKKCPKSCQSEGARIGEVEGRRRDARSAVQNRA
jgi:hypothetical protein